MPCSSFAVFLPFVCAGFARPRLARLLALTLGLSLAMGVAPARVLAQESTESAEIKRLNKQALDAFDNLNFDQSKALLEQALGQADAGGLARDPLAARTHLNLGMLLIAGFQKHDEAVEQFRLALKIQPDINPTPGLFNPEVQAVFEETKSSVRASSGSSPGSPSTESAQRSGSKAGGSKRAPAGTLPDLPDGSGRKTNGNVAGAEAGSGDQNENDENDESDEKGESLRTSGFLVSLGLGSGFGTASGHLDANTAVFRGSSTEDNSWSGGLAASRLGHVGVGVGYFLSPDLLVGLDGRIQIITGTTSTPSGATPPSSAVAVMAKANWYLSRSRFRPFVSGGLGGGTIRQVVKVGGLKDCGSGSEQCVDTVTGGPLFVAAGGGVAIELGRIAVLGSVTANLGIPKWMLNLDLLIGVGIHF